MRHGFRRVAVPAQTRGRSRTHTFPAPIRGWISNENLASAMPGGAYQLDNFFPTLTGIRLRGGSKKYATLSSGAVTSLFSYRVGTAEKFFGTDVSNIFDISSINDADTIPTAAVSGQTSGHYATAQIGTSGGDFLYAVNGSDDAQLYNGSGWQAVNEASSYAITGVNTANLSFVWVFANRLFFVEKGTMNAWYLPASSIAGAASKLPLASVFQKGGSLLFGGTWSLDSGSGLDDKCVFVSTTGEVVIYQGSDPASVSTWSKVGVYEISAPLGMNATMKAGGDFVIATQEGMVPLSQAIQKDAAALSLSAISRQIEPDWAAEAGSRSSKPWHVLKWPSNNMAVVALPVSGGGKPYCFAVNLETGAWARFTGWDTECAGLYNSVGYFGTSDGRVMQMETGGRDDGSPYTGVCVGLFDHLRAPAAQKTVHAARTVFRTASPIRPQVSVSTDYTVSTPAPPNSIDDYTTDEWDVGLWDVATWDVGTDLETVTTWHSIGRTGFAIAPQLQITSGVTPTPKVELVAMDMMFETGGVMV